MSKAWPGGKRGFSKLSAALFPCSVGEGNWLVCKTSPLFHTNPCEMLGGTGGGGGEQAYWPEEETDLYNLMKLDPKLSPWGKRVHLTLSLSSPEYRAQHGAEPQGGFVNGFHPKATELIRR